MVYIAESADVSTVNDLNSLGMSVLTGSAAVASKKSIMRRLHVKKRKIEIYALDAAEDAADAVIVTDAPEEALTRMGYSPAEDRFTREEAGFRLSVSWEEEVRPAGILLSGIIKAETDNGEELLSLPFARYKGAGHE